MIIYTIMIGTYLKLCKDEGVFFLIIDNYPGISNFD